MSTQRGAYAVRLIPADAYPHPVDDNVDVEVAFETGEHFVATFFTVENIKSQLRKYQRTGECRNGLYMWATDMIIVQELTRDVIAQTVDDLIATGEFESAFSGPHTPDPDL